MRSLRESETAAGRGVRFVHDLVWRHAEVCPHAPALIDDAGRTITYGELTRRAAGLAARLQAAGVRPDDAVAVFMERSADVIVAMLAVLRAGGAYVPIDPANPEARIAAILDAVAAAALIVDTALLSREDTALGIGVERMTNSHPPLRVMGKVADRAIPILEVEDADARGDAPYRDPGLQPDHLAYVLFTSGSTGAPKGVAMSHAGLSRLIEWQIGSGPAALRTLQFTPIGFDVTFQEVFSTLATGGTLFVVSEAPRRDPERLLLLLDEHAIERLFLPYVALQQLARAAGRIGVVPRALRHVITAGERLIVTDAIADFFGRLPECRLDNHYGPTEAHLVTSFTLEGDPRSWPALPPIGRAVSGVSLYILDGDLAPVAQGSLGELYVGGGGLARGYLDAPEQTAERFVPDPFRPSARMYRTGDLARLDGEGLVHFAGRVDDQLKVRGYRVEPAEVERCLTSHPGIREAAVGMRRLSDDVEGLVAYVVAEGAVTAAELGRHARAAVPPYMVPSRFVFLDALPLTPTGKTDHRRLRELALPAIGGESFGGESIAQTVRSIWERVLGHDEFASDEDFFDVGGDSLLAAWVVTELSQAVGRDVELSVMLRDSTVDGIANALESLSVDAAAAARESEIITLRPGPSKRVLYLVHPLGGELLAYRALANAIRSPLRVLGMRWRPDLGSGGPHNGDRKHGPTLEEIAAVHRAQLRAIQPHGPYLLAGWSFGGVLAYELAQQLVAAGERVDFLGLFDANPVRDPLTGLATRDSPHYETLNAILAALDRDPDSVPRLLGDSALRRLLGEVPEGVTAAHLKRNLGIARTSMRAAMNYRPAPYSGALDLFQAADAPREMQELLSGELRRLANGVLRIHTISGDHAGILRAPAVGVMAEAVDRALSM